MWDFNPAEPHLFLFTCICMCMCCSSEAVLCPHALRGKIRPLCTFHSRGSGRSINIPLGVSKINPHKTDSVRPMLGGKFQRWQAPSRNDGRWRWTRPGGNVGWVQANGTFSRCLQPNNISVLACLRYLLQATSKLGAIDEVTLATPSGARTLIMRSVCVHVFAFALCCVAL